MPVHRILHLGLLLVLAAAACGHGSSARDLTPKLPVDEDPRRMILIDADRLPDAVVQYDGLARSEQAIAQMRYTLCSGETSPLIFYQLIMGGHWHYYWVCSQKEPVRAMTKRGEEQLSAWLTEVEARATSETKRCPVGSTKRAFSVKHASGTVVAVYCDGGVVMHFPDGGRKALKLGAAEQPAVVDQPASQPTGSGAGAGKGGPQVEVVAAVPTKHGRAKHRGKRGRHCPPCPAATCPKVEPQRVDCPPPPPCPPSSGLEPNTARACKLYGERAFWQGVRKACDAICPAVYKACMQGKEDPALCHKISERCARLPGVCAR